MKKSVLVSALATLALLFVFALPMRATAADPAPAAKNDKVVRECMDNMMKGCDLVIKGSEMVAKGDKDSVTSGQAMIQEGKARIDAGKNDYNAWIEQESKKYGSGN